MIIWFLNQYNTLPKHGHFTRNFNFATHLKELGHEPIVFAGSTPHNQNVQLVPLKKRYLIEEESGFPFVYIRVLQYDKSRFRQIIGMVQFCFNFWRSIKLFPKPDVVIGSSPHLLTALLAIFVGNKLKCKKIIEIRDLWPESIIAFGLLKRNNLLAKLLYDLERYIYNHADEIVFTMQGGSDYIRERGWDTCHGKSVDLGKVHYINNGVDLISFERDKATNRYSDADLEDSRFFKLVYTGTIRRANNIDLVIDAAKKLLDTPVKFLIWGEGTELDRLKKRCVDEKVRNVLFKGSVRKNQIPSILSQADATFFVLNDIPLYRFGLSLNKSFEYLAAGKPILIVGKASYSLVDELQCGLHIQDATAAAMEAGVRELISMNEVQFNTMCINSLEAAMTFDFAILSKRLEEIMIGDAE